jgi:hypothetical protein
MLILPCTPLAPGDKDRLGRANPWAHAPSPQPPLFLLILTSNPRSKETNLGRGKFGDQLCALRPLNRWSGCTDMGCQSSPFLGALLLRNAWQLGQYDRGFLIKANQSCWFLYSTTQQGRRSTSGEQQYQQDQRED